MKFSFVESRDKKYVSIGAIQIIEHDEVFNSTHLWSTQSELFKTPTDEIRENWKIYLNEIIDTIFKIYGDSVTYYLNVETEILWTPYLREIGVIQYLIEKFKDKTLILRDGNLHPVKDVIEFEWDSECIFFGGSAEISSEFQIESRKFSKNFTCIQGRWTRSREEIYKHLYDNNLLYKTYFTFQSHEPTAPFHYITDDGTNYHYTQDEAKQDKIFNKPVMFFPNQWYKNSFCNIVCESTFYPDDLPQTTPNKLFFTEKIEKCFTAGQPFILVGNRNSLSKLREFGFKTFSDFWDESYDREVDSVRLLKIKKLVKQIGSWTLDECQEVWKEMIPILKHNQELNKTFLDKKYKFYTEPINLVTITNKNNVTNVKIENDKLGQFEDFNLDN